jgi:hypothetical protein
MDEDRGSQDGRDEPAPRTRGDWRQMLSTGILLAAVLAILAAGGLLRAGKTASSAAAREREIGSQSSPPVPVASRPEPATASDAEAESVDVPPTSSALRPAPGTAPAPARPPIDAADAPRPSPAVPPPAGGDLGRRAERDLLRLSHSRASFTAQVLVTCKPDNTKRILQKTEGSDRLFLLPLPDRGPTCYRVCWGLYGSPKEAAAASDLPAFLLQGGGRPSAKAVQDLAP